MIKNGLVNVLNIPITNYKGIINVKYSRRNLIKIFEGTHNKTVSKNISKSIVQLNTPERVMRNKNSVMSSITEIPLKNLFNKLNDKVIDVVMDTKEHVVFKELLYKVAETYTKRTE